MTTRVTLLANLANGDDLKIEMDIKSIENNTMLEAMAFQTFVKENAIIPDSFNKAKQSAEWIEWKKAIFTEINLIIENGDG